MKFTSVVSLHTDPMGCGVANFSRQLAQRLGVKFLDFGCFDQWGGFPLFSLKASEMQHYAPRLPWSPPERYGVFWHDQGYAGFCRGASVVFYADPSLGPNGLWCPSLLPEPKRRMVRLFSFGMAHKLQASQFVRVRELLTRASLPFHLRVSVGLHEGTSLSDATKHFDALKDILGADNVTILGILSDDAVAEELANADYVLAFFEKGVRANNTTVHAALGAGCRVITNHDAQTPAMFRMATQDIHQMTAWPSRYRNPIAAKYSWDNLIAEMNRICAQSPSAIAR